MARPRLLALREILVGLGYENVDALILAGRVHVNGVRETRSGLRVREDARIEVQGDDERDRYVSRGAHKLLGAIEDFENTRDGDESAFARESLANRICLDLGASHGGFSQVLLEAGAARVYAIDVARGILDFRVRRDERVITLEKRNARELQPDWLEPEDLARAANADGAGDARGLFLTGDLSFISLCRIFDGLVGFLEACGSGDANAPRPRPKIEAMLLIKPQFERPDATDGGILTDDAVRDEIVAEVRDYARDVCGFRIRGVQPSRVAGAKGNREYFVWCERG